MEQPCPRELISVEQLVLHEGGRLTLARFMELALTHPRLGYYARVDKLLGPGGDFNTAPALSPFFCRSVAKLVTELVEAAFEANTVPPDRLAAVVELGGGEGHLARAVLDYWEQTRPQWRERLVYRLLEVGQALRRRQEQALAGAASRGWRLDWGSDLLGACTGVVPVVIVGNEFLDALPVHLVDVRSDRPREAYVETVMRSGELSLVESWGPVSREAWEELQLLFGPAETAGHGPATLADDRPPDLAAELAARLARSTADGTLEVRPALGPFMEQLSHVMPAGTLVVVDYGEWFPGVRVDCCVAQATEGALRRRTLRGYFKQHPTIDILARPGRQDLTADVDFAALDLHGRRVGFETVVFTSLSAFLRASDAEQELDRLRHALPSQAGETGAGDPAADPLAADPLEADALGTDLLATDPLEADRQATVLAALLNEHDLGQKFKVMVQVREAS